MNSLSKVPIKLAKVKRQSWPKFQHQVVTIQFMFYISMFLVFISDVH